MSNQGDDPAKPALTLLVNALSSTNGLNEVPHGEQKAHSRQFQKNGEGLLECSGYLTTRCLGMAGLRYPVDSTINPSFPGTKENPHYSETYSCAE